MHATFMCMISHNICGKVRIKQQYAAFIYQCIYVPVYLMYIKLPLDYWYLSQVYLLKVDIYFD